MDDARITNEWVFFYYYGSSFSMNAVFVVVFVHEMTNITSIVRGLNYCDYLIEIVWIYKCLHDITQSAFERKPHMHTHSETTSVAPVSQITVVTKETFKRKSAMPATIRSERKQFVSCNRVVKWMVNKLQRVSCFCFYKTGKWK